VSGELNGNSLLEVSVNGSNLGLYAPETEAKLQFTLYADGQVRFSRELTSSDPFRLPAGFRSEVYKIGVSTSVPVYNVTIAESVAELAQASA
jgi:hypothetical protein